MLDFNINNYLRLSATDMLIVCISTFLIVLAAKHFFWDKLAAFIQARQDLIQGDLDAAAQEKQQAQQLKARYEQELQKANVDAWAIIEQAQEAANSRKSEILQEAAKEAQRMKERAESDIEQEKQRAREEMKNAISDAAFEAAKRLMEKEIDPDVQKKYVDDFIAQAKEETWQA